MDIEGDKTLRASTGTFDQGVTDRFAHELMATVAKVRRISACAISRSHKRARVTTILVYAFPPGKKEIRYLLLSSKAALGQSCSMNR